MGGKNLAIKDIAPWVRGSVSTEGLKVAETGHLCSLDCSVAESDRVDKTRLDTSSVVGGGRSRRGGMAEDNNGATLLVSDTCEAKNRHMALEIIQLLSVPYSDPYLCIVAQPNLKLCAIERPPCGSRLGRVVAFE
jgi:hypothetical protein